MGSTESVTVTEGNPPPSLINPTSQSSNLEGADSYFAPKFQSYTPKTLYKVKCPMMLDPKSICMKPSPTKSGSYALSFTGKSECDCAIKMCAVGYFPFATETSSSTEYTERIDPTPGGETAARSTPKEIVISSCASFEFDGWAYDTGIVTTEEVLRQTVNMRDSWSIIIQMKALHNSSPAVEQLLSYCLLRIVEGEMRIKLVTQKCLIQNHGYYITEMYGLDDMTKEDAEKECVICMSSPRNTCVLPCRHVCCCAECANTLRLSTDRCPVCRKPMTEMVYLTVNPQYLKTTADGSGKEGVEMGEVWSVC